MIGLIFTIAAIAYLAVVMLGARFAYSYAKKRGYKIGKRVSFAVLGFLLLTLPIFWDAIPTHIAYNHYCENEAGFTLFKSIEQFQTGNRQESEGFDAQKPTRSPKSIALPNGGTRYFINERFAYDTFGETYWHLVGANVNELIDLKDHGVLARQKTVRIYIGSIAHGGRNWWKFWLSRPSCDRGSSQFSSYLAVLEKIEERK